MHVCVCVCVCVCMRERDREILQLWFLLGRNLGMSNHVFPSQKNASTSSLNPTLDVLECGPWELTDILPKKKKKTRRFFQLPQSLGSQWLQINHRDLNSSTCTLDVQLCPQVTLGSQVPCGFINILYIHTSYYYRVNYGKEIPNTAYCYVTCNCPSKLSIHTHLDEYVKVLSWNAPTSSF